MTARDSGPRERSETLRAAIAEVLRGRSLSAREISGEVHIAEREVAGHLEHLGRSLRARGERLVVEPPACRACGHELDARLTRPSRCPRCKSERISAPRFQVVSG